MFEQEDNQEEQIKKKYPVPNKRPSSLPQEAFWDEEIGQWAIGKQPGFESNVKDGPYTYFHQDGIKSSETYYFHGKGHGIGRRFHQNGEISLEGKLCHSKPHGLWIFRKSTGKTTEDVLPKGLSEDVWSMEVMYSMGMIQYVRYYNKWDEEVDTQGIKIPKKSRSVPETAYFISSEKQWAIGLRSQNGNRQGFWKYFRMDGSLCLQAYYVNDVQHGSYQRFHENGEISQEGISDGGFRHGICTWQRSTEPSTEKTLSYTIDDQIWRMQVTFDRGMIVRHQYFKKQGEEVEMDASHLRKRPILVPEEASWDQEKQKWFYGIIDGGNNKKVGMWRFWDEQGLLIEEVKYSEAQDDASE